MESQWQTSNMRVTADEADRLVELVLRQRLSGSEQIPVNTSELTLHDLARAVGAREEDVALLLCEIRGQKKLPRTRKAIPVRRSLGIIAAIYGGVFFLMAAMFMLGARRARVVYMYPGPGGTYAPSGARMIYHSAGTVNALPDAVGFDFKGEFKPNSGAFGPLDWDKTEQSLNRIINEISSRDPVTLGAKVSDADIAIELAKGDAMAEVWESRNGDRATYPGMNGRLVRWEPLRLTIDDHTISTMIPTPIVADEGLDAAVRANVKQRIARLLKVMRGRLAVPETAPTELR